VFFINVPLAETQVTTTVLSMNAMLEARIVAASTPGAEPLGTWCAWSTGPAASHGCFTRHLDANAFVTDSCHQLDARCSM
jgi:hypothetical protein